MKGSLRRRGGTWQLRVDAGMVNGRRVQRSSSFRGTKKEAEAELRKKIMAAEGGLDLDYRGLTLGSYLEHWLENKRPTLKPRTIEGYEDIFRRHVAPVIGSVKLDKLTPLHVESVLTTGRGNNLSEQSLLHVYRGLSAPLRAAVRKGLIGRNPAEAVEAPKPQRTEVEAMTLGSLQAVSQAVSGTDLAIPMVLAVGGGLRRGEVLGLRWRDVDLATGTVRLSQTIGTRRGGSLEMGTTKSHRSRSLSLPTFVVDALKAHKVAQTERRLLLGSAWIDNDLIVDRGDGSPVPPWSLSQRFRYATTKAGLDVTFHDLRHGFATLSLAAGVSLKVTSTRMGHSRISITADTYTGVSDESDRAAAHALDAYIASNVRP